MSDISGVTKCRPISPHLGIYKKQISSVMSIFHRLTGIGLFFGLSLIIWWFVILVFSKFDAYYLLLPQYLPVKIGLFGLSFGFFYHFCNGIRHLIWDTGRCFSIKALHFTGWFALISSVLCTFSFWFFWL